MRAARARYITANPDVLQRNNESAKASYRRRREAIQKRKSELWDQRMATLRQSGIAHGAL
jgi:hypothetical protein